MGRWLRGLSMALAMLGLGLGSLVLMLRPTGHMVEVGPWRIDTRVGSAAAGPYLRAQIALHGLLALDKREAIYFFATTDDAGRTLDPRCTYTLEGRDLEARWWSVTLYGLDHYLITNAPKRFSITATTAERQGERYRMSVSAVPQPGAWLPAPVDRGFDLLFRVYRPSPAILADPAKARPPAIVRGACR